MSAYAYPVASVQMCTLMFTTPVKRTHLHMHGAHNTCRNACILSAKKCTCTRACKPMQQYRKFFAMEAIANLSWVFREHRAGCRLPLTLLPARVNPSPDAVRSRNPSKSTLAHDAVNAAVSHKHHSIICVGAGLIQFVYGSHSRLAVYLILHKVLFSPRFSRAFHKPVSVNPFKHQFVKLPSKPVETRGIRPKFVKWLTRR